MRPREALDAVTKAIAMDVARAVRDPGRGVPDVEALIACRQMVEGAVSAALDQAPDSEEASACD